MLKKLPAISMYKGISFVTVNNSKRWTDFIAVVRSSLPYPEHQACSHVGFQLWNQNQMEFFVGNMGGHTAFVIRMSTLTSAVLSTEKPEKSRVIGADVRTRCEDGQLSEPIDIVFKEGPNVSLINQPYNVTDLNTYDCLLEDCIDMKTMTGSKRIHAHMIRTGFKPGIFLSNRLVDAYARCGSVENARQVFDKMTSRNTFSWNIMIAAYTRNGDMPDARQLFDKMPERDVVSWNTMIAGYGQNGHYEETLELFIQMQRAGMKPNRFSFASILSACSSLSAAVEGKQDMLRMGFVTRL